MERLTIGEATIEANSMALPSLRCMRAHANRWQRSLRTSALAVDHRAFPRLYFPFASRASQQCREFLCSDCSFNFEFTLLLLRRQKVVTHKNKTMKTIPWPGIFTWHEQPNARRPTPLIRRIHLASLCTINRNACRHFDSYERKQIDDEVLVDRVGLSDLCIYADASSAQFLLSISAYMH